MSATILNSTGMQEASLNTKERQLVWRWCIAWDPRSEWREGGGVVEVSRFFLWDKKRAPYHDNTRVASDALSSLAPCNWLGRYGIVFRESYVASICVKYMWKSALCECVEIGTSLKKTKIENVALCRMNTVPSLLEKGSSCVIADFLFLKSPGRSHRLRSRWCDVSYETTYCLCSSKSHMSSKQIYHTIWIVCNKMN